MEGSAVDSAGHRDTRLMCGLYVLRVEVIAALRHLHLLLRV